MKKLIKIKKHLPPPMTASQREFLQTCTPDKLTTYIANNGFFFYVEETQHSIGCLLVRNPDPAVLVRLYERGFDMSYKCRRCGRLCPLAVKVGASPAILRTLIELGLATSNPFGLRHALNLAASRGMLEYVQILVDAGARSGTALFAAVQSRNPALVQYLVQSGFNVNAREELLQGTVLHFLRRAKSATDARAIVKALVTGGADANARDHRGRTPFHYATQHAIGSSMLESLIWYGADVNSFDDDNHQAWYGATRLSHTSIAILYLAGASIEYGSDGDDMLELLVRPALRQIDARASKIIVRVCASLHHLRLPTLVLCDILLEMLSCWRRLPFHFVWDRVKLVRHFHEKPRSRLRLISPK